MSSGRVCQGSWDLDEPQSTGGSQRIVVPENTLHFCYANVGGVGERGSDKDYRVKDWILERDADIIGMAEVNRNWWFRDAIPFKERAKHWCSGTGRRLNIHTLVAHNEHDVQAPPFQIGGVAIIIKLNNGGSFSKIS